jgi:hypothetical protein
MSDYEKQFIEQLLASDHTEAREWLRAAPGSYRNLGELEPDASLQLVEKLYEMGAAEVIAVEIARMPGSEDQTTNHVLVRLPLDPETRTRLFAFENEHAESEGFDGEADRGQQFIYLKLC